MTVPPTHPFTRFTITAADYANALRLHTRRVWATRWDLKLLLLAVYAGGILAMVVSGFHGLWTSIAIGGMVGAPISLALTYFVLPRRARKIHAQQKTMHQPVAASWTGEGYTASTGLASGTVPWTDYYGWSADGKVVLLMQSQALFQMLPRHALTQDQMNDLMAHIERSGLKRIQLHPFDVATGVNVNIADRDGATPLAHARKPGYSEMVRILSAAVAR